MAELRLNRFEIDPTTCLPTYLLGEVISGANMVGARVVIRIRGHGLDAKVTQGYMQQDANGSSFAFNPGLAGLAVCGGVPAADRDFWCVYAVLKKQGEQTTVTEKTPLECNNCQDKKISSGDHDDVKDATVPDGCTCYCLTWLASGNPAYVPDASLPNVSLSGIFPPTQTETVSGSEVRNATVVAKTYHCTNRILIKTSSILSRLTHNRYKDTRTRGLRWCSGTIKIGFLPAITFYWPCWGPWSSPTRVPDTALSDAEALASGGYSPWCPLVGMKCP